MNKSCHNCEKEISYYAGFCHHCESIQLPKQPEYPELNKGRVSFKEGGGLFGAHKKIETLPNGIELRREYGKDFFRIIEILEEWTDEKDYKISQKWIGKWGYLSEFNIELFNNKNWDPTCALKYIDDEIPYLDKSWMFCQNGYVLQSLNSEENIYKNIEYYYDSRQMRYCITYDRITNLLTEGRYYSPKGELIGTINKDGSYVILRYRQNGKDTSEPTIHFAHEGDYLQLTDRMGLYHEILNRENKIEAKKDN